MKELFEERNADINARDDERNDIDVGGQNLSPIRHCCLLDLTRWYRVSKTTHLNFKPIITYH